MEPKLYALSETADAYLLEHEFNLVYLTEHGYVHGRVIEAREDANLPDLQRKLEWKFQIGFKGRNVSALTKEDWNDVVHDLFVFCDKHSLPYPDGMKYMR